jgi:hypothetical protein
MLISLGKLSDLLSKYGDLEVWVEIEAHNCKCGYS